jgi:hypothetical protein
VTGTVDRPRGDIDGMDDVIDFITVKIQRKGLTAAGG